MKRQTQEHGQRHYAGDDLLELQHEPLKAIDGIFKPYSPCVISGCEITPSAGAYDMNPGLVALSGIDHQGKEVAMVVPFNGINGTGLPVYLSLAHETETDLYGDGEIKPIAYKYYAQPSMTKPTTPYLELSEQAAVGILDAIQNSGRRFVTDADKLRWNNKVDKIDGKGLSANDFTTVEKDKLSRAEDVIASGIVAIKNGEIASVVDRVGITKVIKTPIPAISFFTLRFSPHRFRQTHHVEISIYPGDSSADEWLVTNIWMMSDNGFDLKVKSLIFPDINSATIHFKITTA